VFARLVTSRRRTPDEFSDDDADPLMAFAPEVPAATNIAGKDPARGSGHRPALRLRWSYVVVGALVAGTGVGALELVRMRTTIARMFKGRTGQLSVDTRPAGVHVVIDGQSRGTTPIAVSIRAGTHSMTLRRGSTERVVPLTIAPGAEVTQYFEMPVAEASIAVDGQITVVTEPAGAQVRIDGEPRGVSPLTVTDVSVAPHKVTVTGQTGSAERTVAVERGSTTSVVFALPKSSGPLAGWVSVSSPFDVQIMERADVIGSSGTSGAAKIMLTAGHHDLVLVNAALEYRQTRKLEIAAGRTATIQIDPPSGALSANAKPWADVWIDGRSVGQTPLANLVVPVGAHQVIFRHPDLGERRQTVVVTTRGTQRIAVDFTTDAIRGAK
jgi:serine/threonine-protein kinase